MLFNENPETVMEIKKVKLVYFSPTGTTKIILENIAKGINAENVEQVNLTLSEEIKDTIIPSPGELIIMGAPVYGGRLPVDAIKRLSLIKGSDNPAVVVVTYGNREFEDALLELKNLALDSGFIPVAGGAFIGEHSFSTENIPIAKGRPDALDVQKAIDFGRNIRNKVMELQSAEGQVDLKIPGRFPYESAGARAMAVSPVTKEDLCTLCGTCAGVCPTAAISVDGRVSTEIDLCIRCCACVKNCPTGARVMDDSTWKNIAIWLKENCGTRKEPQIFGIDA